MTSISTDRVAGMLPEGVHPFVVVEFEERTGPSGEYWNFTCEVADGSPFEGQHTWVVISLSPKARFRAEQWMDAFDIPEGMEVDGEDFVGMAFRGKVIHEEYDGKMRAKIDEYLPSKKVASPKIKPKVRKVSEEPEEDGEEDQSEEDYEDTDDSDDSEDTVEDDDDTEEEEQPRKPVKSSKTVKKTVKTTSNPKAVAKKGTLPPAKSKFKRPYSR